jgi:hypothetical protein
MLCMLNAVYTVRTVGQISLKPGCNALQSLESEVNGILGRVRDTCGNEAMRTLHHR